MFYFLSNFHQLPYSRYDIFVDIFDIENRKLYMSANVVVSIKFDEEGYFDVSDSVLNGTWLSGKPLKPGNVLVKQLNLCND